MRPSASLSSHDSRQRSDRVDTREVKGLEKITSIALAEVLSHNEILATDKITDALYTQDRNGTPFVQVLLDAGFITEWDLAKTVCEHFNLPFVMASSFQISKETLKTLPDQILLANFLVPLDVIDGILTVSMPVLLNHDVLEELQKATKLEVFPCVGLVSENKKVLSDMFPGRPLGAPPIAGKKKHSHGAGRDGWQNLFEQGDQAVRKDLGPKG
jgi:hypothetical protein